MKVEILGKRRNNLMFNTGDKVVYPLYGAGVIDAIEEHTVLGELQRYYIVRLLIGGMKVMVPVMPIKEQMKLRKIIEKDDMNRVMDVLENSQIPIIQDWKARYQTNLEKMKTGCIYKVAEVTKNLFCRNKEKGLSSAEKRLFETACSAITSEIAFVQDIGLEQANIMVSTILAQN
ncbi:CarD family transcriptional regulator [Candidatus Desantisbacteria bacterium CG_4_9_14_3_um_filter_40_11]|uniref:CarD family transcriptional regulator n=5 Tax=unclassified Candidatus Desantisiibacteriota TaxID=3106372 RepID=A0A2M7J951_9BACT|nr:MAG: CarD family transcriptional regulator [Candidatus Desantisbacteria bacterium CG23_combo_of_CG06-09_8_20_14_all_40_23]PIX15924.1 MAG: CarD family transcriptional regulator [Candidatus Desantisbacteria bacterium CG_4_8_14_3_um_filter_40_12]PIY19949.1 MAG: CarD family transcriptional regulator [Candidatus Desantisbacteria bacterium CG_4_10_14_3_um_filter_40_18]PJB30121.1 MAG: CarD family transcriptional regulator [Candidatus Desantisbacteria bacterium CG_4_9_14_3_um_filter_40_11]